MTFEKAVRFVEPLLASEVAKKADFFAPEASHPKKCYNEPFLKTLQNAFWEACWQTTTSDSLKGRAWQSLGCVPDPDRSEPSRAGPGGASNRADFDAPRAISRTRTVAPVGWCLPLRPLLRIPSLKVAQTRDLFDSPMKLVPVSIWRKSNIRKAFCCISPTF